MSKIDPSKIAIICINIYKSNINAQDSFLSNPIDICRTKVGVSQESRYNFEMKQISVKLNIVLEGVNSEEVNMGVKGEFGIEFQLRVDNLDAFIEQNKTNNIFKVNGELGATIMGIIYSTARGIILEKTQNSYLQGTIIPIIDPRSLLTQ